MDKEILSRATSLVYFRAEWKESIDTLIFHGITHRNPYGGVIDGIKTMFTGKHHYTKSVLTKIPRKHQAKISKWLMQIRKTYESNLNSDHYEFVKYDKLHGVLIMKIYIAGSRLYDEARINCDVPMASVIT